MPDTIDTETTETTETSRKRRRGYVPPGGVPVYDAEYNHTGFFHFGDIIAVDADPEAPVGGPDDPVVLLVMISRDGCDPVTMRTHVRSMGHFLAHISTARKRAEEYDAEARKKHEEAKADALIGAFSEVIKLGKELGVFGSGFGGEGGELPGFDYGGGPIPYPGGGGAVPAFPPIPRKVGPPVYAGDDVYPFAYLLHVDNYDLWGAYWRLQADLSNPLGLPLEELVMVHKPLLTAIAAGTYSSDVARAEWLQKHRALIVAASVEELRALVETGSTTTEPA